MVGLIVVVCVLLAASAFGLWRKRTDGRVRLVEGALTPPAGADDRSARADSKTVQEEREDVQSLTARQIGGELGSRATLLQFSSAFCQPCRAARVVLADVAARSEGVAHVEVDAESNLELVREVGILRTPTTLILDSAGRIAGRASGVPRRAQVLAVLAGFGAQAQVVPSSPADSASVG